MFGTVVDEIKRDDATIWNMIQLNQFNYRRNWKLRRNVLKSVFPIYLRRLNVFLPRPLLPISCFCCCFFRSSVYCHKLLFFFGNHFFLVVVSLILLQFFSVIFLQWYCCVAIAWHIHDLSVCHISCVFVCAWHSTAQSTEQNRKVSLCAELIM